MNYEHIFIILEPSATLFKSQRYIADDNEHMDDLLIPEEVQKFVRKKLAKIIENRVEFVDIRSNEVTHIRTKNVTSKYDEQIKLLDDVVLQIDWDGNEMPQHSRRKRPEIKKRKLQDVDHSKTEILRLSEAVIDLQDVAKEVNNWMTKPKRTVFRYHEKNGRLFEVEEKTEFSEKRKKNNWDESKIARNKSFSK